MQPNVAGIEECKAEGQGLRRFSGRCCFSQREEEVGWGIGGGNRMFWATDSRKGSVKEGESLSPPQCIW